MNYRQMAYGFLLMAFHAQFQKWETSDKLRGALPAILPQVENLLVTETNKYASRHLGVDLTGGPVPTSNPNVVPTSNPNASMAAQINAQQ